MLISGVSTAVAAMTVWMLTGALWTLAWFAADLALSGIRVVTMDRARRGPPCERYSYVPTLMVAGLAWSLLTGIVGAWCMAHPNAVVAVLGAIVTAGYAGGISSRNSATPRYAMIIIFMVMAPMSLGTALSPIPQMSLAGTLVAVWAIGTIGIMSHNHTILVRMMRAEAAMRELAMTDALTGRHNRAFIDMKLGELHARLARGDKGAAHAVLLIDLDGFKQVNDLYGHWAGDSLLRQVSERLKNCVREQDYVCRLGGDEFVVILNAEAIGFIEQIAGRIIESLARPFGGEADEIYQIGASIGGASARDASVTPRDLLAAADRALYRAKGAGKGRYVGESMAGENAPEPAAMSA